MSTTAQIQILIQVMGAKIAQYQYPMPQSPIPPVSSPSPATDYQYPLTAATPLAINIPAGSQYALIVPQNGGGTLTFKGINGDTGVPISPTNPSLIALGAGATNLVLLSSVNMTVEGAFF